MLEGADGAEFHIAGEQSGSGISEAGVSTPQSQETPDEGFWPSSANLSRRLAVVSPDGADLTTRSRQARRARTLAARPLARAFGRGGGPRRRGEPGPALPLPCLVCGRAPSDAHHLRYAEPRALGRKVSDEFAVPL